MKHCFVLMLLVANALAALPSPQPSPGNGGGSKCFLLPISPRPLAGEGVGERADHCDSKRHSAWGRLFFYPAKPESPVASEAARFDGVLEGRSKTYWVDGVATRRAPPAPVRAGEAWDQQTGLPQPGPRLRQP